MCRATLNDRAGMAWWNNMSETRRAAALKAADMTSPAEAWALWRCQPSTGAFALTVRGDSMVDATRDMSFPDGCIIIVDPSVERPMAGDYVVVRPKHAAEVIFRLLDQEGDNLVLRPLNPEYPIMPLPADARILGVVVQKQTQTWVRPGRGAEAALKIGLTPRYRPPARAAAFSIRESCRSAGADLCP
jgi:Peptidase S24-like